MSETREVDGVTWESFDAGWWTPYIDSGVEVIGTTVPSYEMYKVVPVTRWTVCREDSDGGMSQVERWDYGTLDFALAAGSRLVKDEKTP